MDEKELLRSYLTMQREHVLQVVDALDDEQLRRATLPSGWTPVGLVKHLVMDEERFWFRAVVAGEREAIEELGRVAGTTWTVPADVPAASVVQAYRDEIARADAIIAATDLDAPPAWWPGDLFGSWRLHSLREVMLHLVVEVACHAGHLDAARELIDGGQWLVLTD
ncbi:mycothiol transferase [Desertihabitans aurantiacus]|uniref:mycothiol transferase n=1 Tax=Desertihabitans aurantiacus TaxID=2282477 RepID=UPI000DF783F6|nr:DUF664 domain-containing protein [Desertihabitans aurantiacus]